MGTRKSQRVDDIPTVAKGNEEDQGLEDQNQNPLLNDVVLENLFELIPFNPAEFGNLRLVCKKWNQLATPPLCRNAWIPIKKPLDMALQIQEGNPRFKKFRMVTRKTDLPLWNDFWLKFAPTMTHLDLLLNSHVNINDVRQVIFEMTPNLKFLALRRKKPIKLINSAANPDTIWEWEDEFVPPASTSRINNNLVELTIEDIGDDGDFPISCKELFCYYPNIKVLTLGFFGWFDFPWPFYWHERFLETLASVRQHCGHHHLAHLENLDIINIQASNFLKFSPRVKALLRELAFPLTKLAVDIGDRDYEEPNVHLKEVLATHSPTLRSLTLCSTRSHPSEGLVTNGLDLPHLTELTLIGNVCQSLHFLDELTSLKKLVMVGGWEISQWKEESSIKTCFKLYAGGRSTYANTVKVIGQTDFVGEELRGKVLPNLETVIIEGQVCNGKQVESLAKLMPSVKTLHLGMGNGGFQMLCQEWNLLEHLTIDPMLVNEQGLLGIRKGRNYQVPNLTDLKSLKTLRIGPKSARRHKGKLTNDSITFGVLALKTLVDAEFSVDVEVSEDLKSTLASRFPGMRSE